MPAATVGPWQPPVQTGYTLTSEYGARISPTMGVVEFHTGQDFAAPTGTPALATSIGTVVFTGIDGGYGNLVRIRHANGVETYYAHLSAIRVQAGDQVRKGDPVGAIGSTGKLDRTTPPPRNPRGRQTHRPSHLAPRKGGPAVTERAQRGYPWFGVPPPKTPRPAAGEPTLRGKRVILSTPDGFVYDMRAASEIYTDGGGSALVDIVSEGVAPRSGRRTT